MLIVIITMLTASMALIVIRIGYLFIHKIKQICNKNNNYQPSI